MVLSGGQKTLLLGNFFTPICRPVRVKRFRVRWRNQAAAAVDAKELVVSQTDEGITGAAYSGNAKFPQKNLSQLTLCGVDYQNVTWCFFGNLVGNVAKDSAETLDILVSNHDEIGTNTNRFG